MMLLQAFMRIVSNVKRTPAFRWWVRERIRKTA
jgi:hypothetical protein